MLLLLSLPLLSLTAQQKTFTISGNIRDKSNGEDLIGAVVASKSTSLATTSNAYGFYSLTLPVGTYTLVVSYTGYVAEEIEVDLQSDVKQHISLLPLVNELQEVVVSSERKNANVSRPEMSVEKLSAKAIKKIPALMGEVDVIKAIQLLPGVQATSEGSSGFSVRGGNYDQNLILLDEATVYSASHLMGFFSVFNNDAVKDVKLYKGDIPAAYGGRLASLMDIRSKDGNNQRFAGTGGIGTISSRLTLEGPLGSDKLTYLLSGRRTYADLFLALSNDEDVRNSSLYFYDMNGKINYRIDDNNRVFLSAYSGRDNTSNEFFGMAFGNQTLTARWNHIFTPKLFSNFTLLGSFYNYKLKNDVSDQLAVVWESKMADYSFKADMTYHLNPNTALQFGYALTYHRFTPAQGGGVGENSILGSIDQPQQFAMDQAAYLSGEATIAEKLILKAGLRYSLFQNIGNDELTYRLGANFLPADSARHGKGSFYHTQGQFEPRLGATYLLSDVHSLKASYSRTAQYIQLASNSAAGSPLDIWFQASPNVKPQLCDQFAIGYFRNFSDNDYEASLELYYKDMQHVVDFKDHAELLANKDLEQELRFGKGRAYGLEFMLRKNTGRLNGWLSYTFSKASRQIDEINKGKWYRSPFDKPHNISLVLSYELSPKWSISGNWIYASGVPVTYPTGRFLVEDRYVRIYSDRNKHRYPDYHRMDLSATLQLSKPSSRFKSELNFSLYNAYGRKNAWTVLFRQEDDQPDVTYAEKIYLFTFVPSITYNFTF